MTVPDNQTYDIGDKVYMEAEFRDPITKRLTTPTTTVLTVYKPDGTSTSPATTTISTGVKRGSYVTADAGLHHFKFVASGNMDAVEWGSFIIRANPI